MDPQSFLRLTVGSLAVRLPNQSNPFACTCQIQLHGFPIQTLSIPSVSSSTELTNSNLNSSSVFYLEESQLNQTVPSYSGCFRPNVGTYVEISVYMEKGRGDDLAAFRCSVPNRKQLIGRFRMEVGSMPQKPVLLYNGWVAIGRNGKGRRRSSGKVGPELHLMVRAEPDPRYVFRFEDETVLSPQIVQVQGRVGQSIFSCKFSRDRRTSHTDRMHGHYRWGSEMQEKDETECTNIRKGWKVVIHDLSGSAVAAACMSTPFVPSAGSDRVARSNPGAWLILRPDPTSQAGTRWHPWARLEAWREIEEVSLQLHLLPQDQESSLVVSETLIKSDHGGEFVIDLDRNFNDGLEFGFVMSCKVEGEEKCSKPVVQLATRHVTCVEDAAIFVALAAAVDLSVKACRPFGKKNNNKKGSSYSLLS